MSTTSSPPKAGQVFKIGTYFDLAVTDERIAKSGALATSFRAGSNGYINIRYNYPWTLTPVQNRTDVPTIILKEYRTLEGNLKQQTDTFLGVIKDKFIDSTANDPLEVYEGIWEKSSSTSTNIVYLFPYFNDIGYSMGTAPWQVLDGIGGKIAEGVKEGAGALGDFGAKNAEKVIKGFVQFGSTANALTDAVLKFKYPGVGVADRPKVFAGHTERSFTIEFPLFNTIHKDDWIKNLEFIQLFASQNLFNKRDYVTGNPPVWYEVEVPGQYFCYAASVTDFTVKNLGNIHSIGKLKEEFSGLMGINVPDAYQISITMQEMTQPSKNQYQRVISQYQAANKTSS